MRAFCARRWPLARILIIAVGMVGSSLCGASCVSTSRFDPSQSSADLSPPVFSSLPRLTRLSSASGDFRPYCDGADYASELSNNRCAGSGASAVFTPDFAAPNSSLSDAAFCLYRLELDPAATSATLTLVWHGVAPDSSACWVGFSAWGRGGWDWKPLVGNEVHLDDPAAYADTARHCYVTLVVVGTTQVELASIRFGALPLPPPSNGYTLFAPLWDKTTYLIDEKGNVAHSWPGKYVPGAIAMLADDGILWRQVKLDNPMFQIGGSGGRLEQVDWDGNVIWSFELSTGTQCTHHDFTWLPNGNVLVLVWNKITWADAVAAGRNPASLSYSGMYVDSIFELKPSKTVTTIVWQWFASDHLVQDFDSHKANYGDPAAHPELIDFNYSALAYDDWLHLNAVDYNPELDQIVVSSYCLSELWVIDHSTSVKEARGHAGGRYGHGGDLLYRWGNPQAYRAGTSQDRMLFTQHDVHWITPGLPGAGNLLIFNNTAGAKEGREYSTVVEITTPLNPDGSYYKTGPAYGPQELQWQYKANPPEQLYGSFISGCERLPDGNSLICCGPTGRFIEVKPDGETVWEYDNPYPLPGSAVFRAIRYPVDYPGLAHLAP
jgi:hypothetical protein